MFDSHDVGDLVRSKEAIHEELFQSSLSTHNFIERFLSDLETATPMEVKQRQGERIRPLVPR